jgi:hypothetical protein
MPARASLFTALALLTVAVLMFYALMNNAHSGQPASPLALTALLMLIVASLGCAAVGLRQALGQPEASSIALLAIYGISASLVIVPTLRFIGVL